MVNSDSGFTYQEIVSQAGSWSATLQSLESLQPGLVQWLHSLGQSGSRWGEVLFTGCGSTYYLSLSIAQYWSRITGIPARALPASELWLNPACSLPLGRLGEGPSCPPLLVAVSRSGETTETLRALETYRQRLGGECLAVTCYPGSTLARQADRLLLAYNADEQSVAQTRSFTSMYLLLQAAACLTAGRQDLLSQFPACVRAFPRLLDDHQTLIRGLAENSRFEQIFFLGSAINYGLACEAMLKMKEMSLTAAEAYHFMEFRHGPKSMAGPGMLIVSLLDALALPHENQVLAEMRQLGASVLAVTEGENGISADYHIALRSGVDYLASRVLVLPLLQLLAYYRALHKGLNPDRPTNLEAVVKLA